MKIRTAIAFFIFLLVSSNLSLAGPAIKWEIVNNNRFFKTSDSQSRFEDDLITLVACSNKKNRSRAKECRKFFKRSRQPSPKAYETRWSTSSYKHDSELVFGSSRKIKMHISGLRQASRSKCTWSVNDGQALPGNACERIMRLNLGEHKISVRIHVPGKKSPLDLHVMINIRDILFAVIGDSFLSGEGNPHRLRKKPDYRYTNTDEDFYYNNSNVVDKPGKPAEWLEKRCHRSLFAGPAIAAAQLAQENRHISVSYLSFACSGSEIDDGLRKPYIGRETAVQANLDYDEHDTVPVPSNNHPSFFAKDHLPTQLDSLWEAMCKRKEYDRETKRCSNPRRPDYLLVSSGVNEFGFSRIVLKLGEKKCRKKCFKKLGEEIELKSKQLVDQYRDLVSDISELSPQQVMLMEYLDPTHDEKGKFCDDTMLFKKRTLAGRLLSVGFRISKKESKFAYKNIVVKLNSLLKKTANMAKWRFIGGMMNNSRKKGFCSKKSWFLRVPTTLKKQWIIPSQNFEGKKIGGLPSGVLHPNIYGHHFMAERLKLEFKKDKLLVD